MITGRRKFPPSTKELEFLRSAEDHMVVKILMCDNTSRAIFVNGLSVAKEVNTEVSNKLILTTGGKYFGLFEVNDQIGLSRPIMDNEYLCDLMSKWETATEGVGAFKFGFKRKYLLEDPEKVLEQERQWTEDAVAFDLYFNQAKEEVLEGKLPVNEREASYLAALLLQLRHPNSQKAPLTKENAHQFIPAVLLPKQSLKNWCAAIELHMFEVVGQPSEYTKLLFFKTLAKVPLFGSTTFQVNHKEAGQKVILAINRKGLNIFDSLQSREARMVCMFRAIGGYTLTEDAFVIQTGNLMKPLKCTFVNEEPNAINTVYQTYADNAEQNR
eukprot:TRINITY_DN6358_c0_g1_i3.p1 TRINITY_DN6358_c0_g1~~TRINITY_DN6358_c0_g1_i3.p1  ORF type:complete len:327 (-),score=88.41 TRINITY_DN6358_c0_g1_i3:40-1020(-)